MTRALGALLCCALGCSNAADLQRHAEPIILGEASGPDEDGVVLLRAVLEDETEVLCTASLVAPNLVITARHCVSYLNPSYFSCNVRGELIDNPDGGGTLGAHLPAESIEIYGGARTRRAPLAHGQSVISTLAEGICTNDLAFVVLDASLELPIVPLRLDGSARVGEAAVLVGYGLTDGQKGIDYRTQPRARKPGLEVAEVGPDSLADGVTTAPPRTILLNGPSGCIGDSGGPLLSSRGGAVLGVYSLQNGDSCADEHVQHQLTHVSPYRALIAEAFAAADAQPTLEASTNGGAAGAANEIAAGAGEGGSAQDSSPDESLDSDRSSCALARTGAAQSNSWALAALLLAALRRRRAT